MSGPQRNRLLAQDWLLLWTIGLTTCTAVVSWVAAVLSGLPAHGRPAALSFADATSALPRLLSDPIDPAHVYAEVGGRGVGGPLLFWPILLSLGTATGYLIVTGRRAVHDWLDDGTDGLAGRGEVEAALGEQHALELAAVMRPSLAGKPEVAMEDIAVPCGTALPSGVQLWLTIEESITVLAPQRSGKTSQLIVPTLLRWPGPALATSARTDVLYQTARIRRDLGHAIHVLDPYQVAAWPQTMRWSLTDGCEDYNVVQRRTEALIAATRSEENTKNGGYFVINAKIMINCWLHAAGLAGLSARHVMTWATNSDDRRPIEILAERGRPDLAGVLADFYAGDSDEKRSSWKTAFQPFAALLNPQVADIFACEPGESINLSAWLRDGGTIYVIGEEDDNSLLSPLLAAFGRACTDTAKRAAARTPSGRLDPPLGIIGDELANSMPLPELPQLMSLAGGFGIFILASLQNLAQAERRWGRVGARQLLSGATVKIILGGIGDPEELKMFSDMIGEFDDTTTSHTEDRTRISVQTSVRRRPVLDLGMIRMVPARTGVLIHRETPAVRVKFTRAHEGPDADQVAAAVRWAVQVQQLGAIP